MVISYANRFIDLALIHTAYCYQSGGEYFVEVYPVGSTPMTLEGLAIYNFFMVTYTGLRTDIVSIE